MKDSQIVIAFGLTQEEALVAQRTIINKVNCAPENITIITDPAAIFSLRSSEVDLIGVKAHATDQQQWSKLMPICRYMKENNIKFQIIK